MFFNRIDFIISAVLTLMDEFEILFLDMIFIFIAVVNPASDFCDFALVFWK